MNCHKSLDMKSVGKRIRALREKGDMSQNDLASQANISCAHVRKIESGTCNPSLRVIYEIALVFDVSLDYLVGRELFSERKGTQYIQVLSEKYQQVKRLVSELNELI